MYAIAALVCAGAGVGTVWKIMQTLSNLLKRIGVSYGALWVSLLAVGGFVWLNGQGLLPKEIKEPSYLLFSAAFYLTLIGLAGTGFYVIRLALSFLFRRFIKKEKRLRSYQHAKAQTIKSKSTTEKRMGLLRHFFSWVHSNPWSALLFWGGLMGFGWYYLSTHPSVLEGVEILIKGIETLAKVIGSLLFIGILYLGIPLAIVIFIAYVLTHQPKGILLKGEDGKTYRAYEVGENTFERDSHDPTDPHSSSYDRSYMGLGSYK